MANENAPIQFQVTVTVSAWCPPNAAGERERVWTDLPSVVNDGDDDDDGCNCAARIERRRGFWPFHKWSWSVWSPFNDDEIAEGTAPTPEVAMRDADAALRSFIAGVSGGVPSSEPANSSTAVAP